MSPEQLLMVAREFCARHGVRVTDYAALVAAAAASAAKIEGIPVHGTPHEAARAMVEVLTKVGALSEKNREFAHYAAQVYLSVAEVM